MNIDELNEELLLSARYGDAGDILPLVQAGANVNFKDENGNTPLHFASANGHMECAILLRELGAEYLANISGNFPLHWAVQNSKLDITRYLVEHYDVNMLAQNNHGRSILTDAFQSNNIDILQICLSHPTANEEDLLPTDATSTEMELDDNTKSSGEKHAVTHTFLFQRKSNSDNSYEGVENSTIQMREMPMTRADNPFGGIDQPQNDSTGLALWPASVLLSQFIVSHKEMFHDKVVLELGAGCGLPGIVTALSGLPKSVYISDIHIPALNNLMHNLLLNGYSSTELPTPPPATAAANATASDMMATSSDTNASTNGTDSELLSGQKRVFSHPTVSPVITANVSWEDPLTYPEPNSFVDVLLGSDLVYEERAASLLAGVVSRMLKADGLLVYIAPITDRLGMEGLVTVLQAHSIQLESQFLCPQEYYENPLASEDYDQYLLYFYDLTIKTPFTIYLFRKIQ